MAHSAKEVQISFRVEEDFGRLLNYYADAEDLPVADFCRKLCKRAVEIYTSAGNLQAFKDKTAMLVASRDEILRRQTEINSEAHKAQHSKRTRKAS
jgi:hypothetical protein